MFTGDVVGVLTPNTPCFVELHHAVNMAGATINPINTRLDASTLAYVLAHSGAKVLLVDTGLTVTVRAAIEEMKANGAVPPMVVDLEVTGQPSKTCTPQTVFIHRTS